MDNDISWSLKTWKERHDHGYFPNSVQHRNWKIYDAPPSWLVEYGKPQKDDVVLEIGCGYGEWMIPLAPMVESVFGIDIHSEPINVAVRKFNEYGLSNCHVSVSDGTSIPIEDENLSLIYSISVFQHIPKKMTRRYLKEAYRVCRVGGRGLFHFRSHVYSSEHGTPAEDIAENHQGDFSCGWTDEEIYEAATQAGWKGFVHVDGLFLVFVGEK